MTKFQEIEFEELSLEEMSEISGGASKYLCSILGAQCSNIIPGRYSSISQREACVQYATQCL
ncbi:bacteriocin [Paenibacillus sp. WLX2291]|uniref:bacteriocin n=1 Tax=Paenibacillus sp. WLX2291 TaxID=3296934 RepID=UPI0039843FA8